MEISTAGHVSDAVNVPRVLPRGPYALPRDVVLLSQRRRMLDAVVEAVAEKGYGPTSVKDVIGSAGVSRKTFYQQFSDKEACFLAAYREGAHAHYRAVLAAVAGQNSPLEALRAGVRTYLGVLAAEPAFARAFLLEIVGAGERGREMHDQFRERYVELLEQLQPELARERDLSEIPSDALRGAAAAIDALIVHQLAPGTAERTPGLEVTAVYILLAVLGLEDAAEIAGIGR
jgi:AcrR family transcriptional regulator